MALEVTAATVGLLAAAGKVAEALGPVVSAFLDAPEHAGIILAEVNHTRTALLGLQGLFNNLQNVPQRRKELLPIDQLVASFTDGVLLFSKLEELVDHLGPPEIAWLNRMKWGKKSHELDAIVARLLSFRTSMALMLGILQWYACASHYLSALGD